jgi:hypothetical protein
MNEPALAAGQTPPPASPAIVRVFLTLLRKDLRLAAPIVTTFFALLVTIAGLFAALPLFGNQAMRSFGFYAGVHGVWDRLGLLQPLFAGTLAVATILSALSIASREGGARSRFLLPTLPVSTRLAYLSKIQALLMIFALFLALLPLTDRGRISGIGLWPALVAFTAAMSVWAFAAPYFVRGFAGGFLAATLLPVCLYLLIILGGERLIPAIFIELFHRWELDPWYWYPWWGENSARGDRQILSSTETLVFTCTSGYAFGAVTLLGLWAAWCARKAVLCRQTPQPSSAAHVGRLLLIAFASAATVVAAASVHAWSADPSIRRAAEISRWHARTAQLTTDAVLREYVSAHMEGDVSRTAVQRDGRGARQGEGSHGSDGFDSAPLWDVASGLAHPGLRDPLRIESPRFELSKRLENDRAGVEAALATYLAGADFEQLPIGIQLEVARLLGPRTMISLALRRLAEGRSDIERCHLINAFIGWALAVVPRDQVRGPQLEVGEEAPFYWTEGLGLAPFEPVRSSVPDPADGTQIRIAAVLLLELLRTRLEDGTLVPIDPARPADRLSIDADLLAKARAALEQPFAELARDIGGIAEPTARDAAAIEAMSENQRLYLRTSELFDPAKTDPSYLLPNR